MNILYHGLFKGSVNFDFIFYALIILGRAFGYGTIHVPGTDFCLRTFRLRKDYIDKLKTTPLLSPHFFKNEGMSA